MQKTVSQGFRLSPQQQHVWWAQRGGAGPGFVVQTRIDIAGALDRQRLAKALEQAVERHEILRTTFPLLPGLSVPVQSVEDSAGADWSEHSLVDLPAAEREAALGRLCREIRETPFDLVNRPLLRATLIGVDGERHALLLSQPALAADGVSLDLLAAEVAAAYHGAPADGEALQYADLAELLHEWQGSPADDPGPSFWHAQDLSALTRVTLGRGGLPNGQPFRPEHVQRRIDRAPVEEVAARFGSTISLVLLAGWHAALHLSTGEEEIIVGTLFDGRTCEELESALGPFARYLPVRARSDAGSTLADLSRVLSATVADVARRQDFFSSESVARLLAEHGASGWPFGFDYRRPRELPATPGAPTFAIGDGHLGLDRFGLRLSVLDDGRLLRADLAHDPVLFPRDEAESLLERLARVLDGLLAGACLGEIDVLTAAERQQVLLDFNRTESPMIPAELCAHHLFEEQARRVPHAPALVHAERTWTYAELESRAGRLAGHLRAAGVGPGSLVGVCLERSPGLVEALLGILEVGAAYVPLDPGYPADSLCWMAKDAGISLLLTQESLQPRFCGASVRTLRLEELADEGGDLPQDAQVPSRAVSPADLAYVIYTSGSTGRPKGVMIPHRGLVNYLLWARQAYAAKDGAGAPVHSAIGFDLTVTSLLVPLASGTAVTLLDERRSVVALVAALRDGAGFSLVKLTPAHLDVLRRELDPEEHAGRTRALVIGGEALRAETVAPWREHAPETRLINEYGPTEATVGCCVHEIAPGDAAEGPVAIGRPIANTRLYVVGPGLRPVPPGAPGELWIGGDGLARGYLGRPELTAERFIPDLFAAETGREGERLYRTGDLVRLRPDGLLEFLGRIDGQLKIRGFRIEPGEIEAALAAHPKVLEAAVVAREDDHGKRLVAYAVPRNRDERPAASELRRHLEERLPDYMVPAVFVVLDSLPLTPNGKLDRQALPDPGLQGREEAPYVPPRTLSEEVLAEIWGQVLGVDRVGIDDHFFSLGGDSIRSLQILALTQKRGLGLTLQDLFQRTTIRALAERVRLGKPEDNQEASEPFSLVPPADRAVLPAGLADAYPLARLQAGMLFHSDHSPESAIFNDQHSIYLRGPLLPELLQSAVDGVVRRHAVLRTSFDLTSFGEPLQLVHEEVAAPVAIDDLLGLAEEAQEEAIAEWLRTDRHRAWDWSRAPLTRFHVHRRSADTFQFTLSFHHSILDGWSAASLLAELFRRYAQLLAGTTQREEPPPAASFRELVRLERSALTASQEAGFWDRYLEGAMVVPLPRWSPPAGRRRRALQLSVTLPAEVVAGLRALARTTAVPLKSVLLAAHCKVMGFLTGTADVLTGLSTNGRPEQAESEQVLGLFLNNVPFRQRLGEETWEELAQTVFANEREILPHRRYPLADIQAAQGGQPLFEVAFNFLHYHIYQGLPEVAELEVLGITGYEETNFPLIANFFLDPRGSGIQLLLGFPESQLAPSQVEAIAGAYLRALGSMAAEPGRRHAEVSLLSEPERHLRLREWNPASAALPSELVHERIRAQALRTPDAPAVAYAGETLSYAELLESAHRLARHLRRLGVETDTPVAVALDRSPDLSVTLLAVLAAGGAYLPLDGRQPRERLALMLEEGPGVRFLVTSPRFIGQLPPLDGLTVIDLERDRAALVAERPDDPAVAVAADGLAYVLYTSGSTGRPKGVMVPHRGLANYLDWAAATYPVREGRGAPVHSPIGFDLTVTSLFLPLLTGGCADLLPENGDLDGLAAALTSGGFGLVKLTPAHLQALAGQVPAEAVAASTRSLVVGGEALLGEVLKSWPGLRIFNEYGPTETVVGCCVFEQPAGAPLPERVPIGRPVANTRLLLLDTSFQPVPLGAAGELWIAGAQVARGYFGCPDLTAERFLPDPSGVEPGARAYRTGDLARHLPAGLLEYLGRADSQVKVRGYRIELAEIEAVLTACPAVDQAVVVLRSDAGEARLTAYAVLCEKTDVRAWAAERLPEYMVPVDVVEMAALPLTANGKIDRARLPAPAGAKGAREASYVAPRSPAEETLAAIWAEVLGVERVGTEDNFFELGGDSILSLQIAARARRAGLSVNSRLVLQHPTVAELATLARMADPAKPVVRATDGPAPLTPIQRWFFAEEMAEPWHFNQAVLLTLAAPLSPGGLGRALEKIAMAHPALRLRFQRGPAGWEQRAGGTTAAAAPLTVVDLAALPEGARTAAVTAAAAQAQAGLDLERGPLHRVLLLGPAAEGARRLLWAIHHLAVDGVSWRVLLEDLQTAWRDACEIPAEETTFAAWAGILAERAHRMTSEKAATETAWWTAEATAPAVALPIDSSESLSREADARRVAISLDAAETQALLQEVPAAWRTQINDVLLTALALALAPAGGALRVDLEGHGREEGVEGADLARTVGWFTTLFPVRLEVAPDGDPIATLLAIKEHLRALPGNGLGYGLLRWLRPDDPATAPLAAAPPVEVGFNYLGQLDAALAKDSIFAPAPEPAGPTRSPHGKRAHLLEVLAYVAGGRLRVEWEHSETLHRRATIEALADRYTACLRELIVRCRAAVAAGRTGATPSDFPLARIDQAGLDSLLASAPQLEDLYPLSSVQEGMLFHSLYAPEAGAYVDQLLVRLRDELEPELFQEAWSRVVQHNPVLRTSFHWQGIERPLQAVHAEVPVTIEREDWSSLPAAERESRLAELMEADRARGLDLAQAPPMRWRLIRTGEDGYAFLWTHHHILMDGWSLSLVLGDLVTAFAALREDREPALPHRRPYRDYIAWLGEQSLASTEEYWRRTLAGWREPIPLGMSTSTSGRSGTETRRSWLSAEETAELQVQARRHQVTLNTLVQAAWATLLARTSGHHDVVFGATVSGRPELEGADTMVGLFINTLPVRVRVGTLAALPATLRDLQEAQAELRQHEHSPLVQVQGWSEVPRGRALFDSILVFENYPRDASLGPDGAALGVTGLQSVEHTHYPLNAMVIPGEHLVLDLGYDRARFEDTAMLRLAGHLRNLLAGLAARLCDGGVGTLLDLPLLAEEERHQLLVEWNATAEWFADSGHSLRELIEAQVDRTPQALALVGEEERLTYEEMDRAADRLAWHLIRLGIGPESRVGVALERSPRRIVALLAVWKAGGAYLPLNLEYPRESLAGLLEDAGAAAVITERQTLNALPPVSIPVILADERGPDETGDAGRPPRIMDLDQAAYVIYTSGSTGRPKGVVNTHRGVANRLLWGQRTYDSTPADRVLQKTPFSFDVSVWEMFWPLMHGARLVIARPGGHRDPAYLHRRIAEEGITTIHFVPSMLQAFLEERDLSACASLRRIFVSGEALTFELQQRLFALLPGIELHNLYGPTEASIEVTFEACDPQSPGPRVPIGRPVANTRIHLLDRWLEPVPVGVPGELHIGGIQVARGYHGRPGLTAERFVPDPAGGEPGARLYRTGDLARHLPDGSIDYLGRVDLQVKIRGQRIELSAIEGALCRHPAVVQAVVAVWESAPQDRRLAAWVVPAAGAAPDPAELRAHLRTFLPEVMVPSAWTLLTTLPLTSSGKVDRASLPSPDRPAVSAAAYEEPQTAAEREIAAIWRDLLGAERVGLHDNFFDLGGHSLLLMRAQSRLSARFGREISMVDLFSHPTVSTLALLLTDAADTGTAPVRSAEQEERMAGSKERLRRLRQGTPSDRRAR